MAQDTLFQSDFLVIGAGVAGLSFALRVAELGHVNVLLKDAFKYSSTQLAQGGINAVFDEQDSFEAHIQDTLRCGYGLCHAEVVEQVVNSGPEIIDDLIKQGVRFTRDTHGLSLHREGGHAFSRVVHAKDATGSEIMRALVDQVRSHERIHVFPDFMAIDLIMQHPPGAKTIHERSRAIGAYVLDGATNRVHPFLASVTYLATGGIGKVYPYTSNPRTATGDGIVMAYRAGIPVVNMEFVQFHPTILFHHKEHCFLISEAVRGEGAILRNRDGEAFMEQYDPVLKDLAPRDVVARAIDAEIKKSGDDCVFLDLSSMSKAHIIDHFPNIYQHLLDLGLDITRESIPVVPAAHYSCGGLATDRFGGTSCHGLFAGGECTFTGLHGANRLASNSLLEAAVFARASADFVQQHQTELLVPPPQEVAPWEYHDASDEDEESLVHPLWREVRQFMWNYVGIIRTEKRLQRAIHRIEFLRREIENSYWNFKITKDLVELRNISVIAELITRSALSRKESRGLHFHKDYPKPDPAFARDTVISLATHGLFR